MYLAHLIIDSNGNRREQTLREHCRNVAQYTSECMKTIGLQACGMLAGLLHDGKGTDKFQTYLKQAAIYTACERGYIAKSDLGQPSRGSVNHTFAGTIYLFDKYHKGTDFCADLTVEVISCAISSHHGLFDCMSLDGKNGFEHRVKDVDRIKIQYEQAKEAFENEISSVEELEKLFSEAQNEISVLVKRFSDHYFQKDSTSTQIINFVYMQISLLVRMLTSALIYADRRDTAEFYDQKNYEDKIADWNENIIFFEKKYNALSSGQTGGNDDAINIVRSEISRQCMEFAENPEAIYRLNVPTGGGKTLSSLRYALHHAAKFQKKKIIYVIPLLTIIDQNASDIKEYLKEKTVLEHHSDVVREDMNQEKLKEYDLLKDRWSAPVIITTLVQILEKSVPLNMLALFNSALNFLAWYCGTTIILCSATQPEFNTFRKYPLDISDKTMVSLQCSEMQVFKRQQYHNLCEREISLDELTALALRIVRKQNPLMIVCNTKSEAINLYKGLSKHTDLQVMHLSAGMCKAHRKKVIDVIKMKLSEIQTHAKDERFVLVTTQLVEAGVNLSFRSVIRLLAGNDNLVQSAGRCNRSNEYQCGDVYLVRLQGEASSLRQLPDIVKAKEALLNTIHDLQDKCGFVPESKEFIADYYKRLFKQMELDKVILYPFNDKDNKTWYMVSLLENSLGIDKDVTYCLHQPFASVGRYFKVFDESTFDVMVPYGEGKKLIEQMRFLDCHNLPVPVAMLRKSSDYIIQIYEWQKKKLEGKGLLEYDKEGHFYYLNSRAYNEAGLDIEAELTAEELAI